MIRDPESGALVGSAHLHALEEMINDVGGVVFVGIDPALGVTEGDEASQSDQRALGAWPTTSPCAATARCSS